MQTKFNKSTDSQHQEKLESSLLSAVWRTGGAPIGGKASFEILTSFVGNNADIKISGKSEKGKKLGKVDGKIRNNRFIGELEVPSDIKTDDFVFFEVDLPQNGLKDESNHIPVVPAIRVTNMKWSAKEAREKEILTLSADVQGVKDDTEAIITIYEYDRDSIHDKIVELKTEVQKDKIELKWEYLYFEDTDEIATDDELKKYGKGYNPPEYFFVIDINGQKFGKKQESGLLTFKDWIEIQVTDASGEAVPNLDYTIRMPDGTEKKGKLDGSGMARIDDIPPGPFRVVFPNYDD